MALINSDSKGWFASKLAASTPVYFLCILSGLVCCCILAGQSVIAHDMHDHHTKQAACDRPDLACASSATPTFAADGSLWLVWGAGGYVSVAKSNDLGQSFGVATKVNKAPLQLDRGPDAGPKIVIDKTGRVFVIFSILKDKFYNGQVLYTSSTDGGLTFSEPRPITANEESQRFEAVALNEDGKLFAAWVDKRNRVPAKEKGEKYAGAGLAFAWATADHTAVGEARIAHDNTCECCRIGVAFAGGSRPVLVFRNIFDGGIRDHAVMTFADPETPGPVRRVSIDNWKTDACPHQGPSLAVAPDGAYHVAWYTDGQVRSGLFYARSKDSGQTFSDPLAVGNPDHNPSRPALLALDKLLWLAWKEFDGQDIRILAIVSHDGGASWSQTKELARTHADSDHPLLIAGKGGAFLSWLTHDEGYRLISLEPRS